MGTAPSYAHGASPVPLLGETIGARLDATIARYGEREALVSHHQDLRYTYAELGRGRRPRRARPASRSGSSRATASASGARTAPSGRSSSSRPPGSASILVNINPAYRTTELEYALRQSGCRVLVAARAFKTSDYVAMVAEVRGSLPGARARRVPRRRRLGRAAGRRRRRRRRRGRRPPGRDAVRRRDQHPVHERHDGLPQGRHAQPPQHPQQRLLRRRRGCRYTESDRVCIPVPFYHCFGMVHGQPRVRRASALHGRSRRRRSSPAATLEAVAAERCTSLYGVPTMFIAELDHPRFDEFDLSSLRTGIMAGSPCPIEVMSRVVAEMHMEEVTICYGMTETSPVSTQTAAEDPLEKRVDDGRAGAPARRGQDARPGRRRRRRPRRARRAVHPRLLGDARLLGRPGADRRGHRPRPAGCTPATSRRWTTRAT